MSHPVEQWDDSANADDGKVPPALDESDVSRHHVRRGNSTRSGSPEDRPSPRRHNSSSRGSPSLSAPPNAFAFAMDLVAAAFWGAGERWNLPAAAAAAAGDPGMCENRGTDPGQCMSPPLRNPDPTDPKPPSQNRLLHPLSLAGCLLGLLRSGRFPLLSSALERVFAVAAREHWEIVDDRGALARGVLLGAAAILLRSSQDHPAAADPLAQPTEAAAVGEDGEIGEDRAAQNGDASPQGDGNLPLGVDAGWTIGCPCGGETICNFCWELIRDLQMMDVAEGSDPPSSYPTDGPAAAAVGGVPPSPPHSKNWTKRTVLQAKGVRKKSKANLKLKPPPPSLNRPLITDFNPQVDVSCGRGGFTNNNPANRGFLRRRDELADAYHLAARKGNGKAHLRDELVSYVRNAGGRFLRPHPTFLRTWFELSVDEARSKASQALRDGYGA